MQGHPEAYRIFQVREGTAYARFDSRLVDLMAANDPEDDLKEQIRSAQDQSDLRAVVRAVYSCSSLLD